jgi:penicillin-binding protein 1A
VLALVPLTPGIGDIRKARIDRPALIVSADGRVVEEFKPVNREWVSLGQISPYVVAALIDRRSTLLRALRHRLAAYRIGRAAYVLRRPTGWLDDHAAARAITALKIEAVYSKDQIHLETYLNNAVPVKRLRCGNGCTGLC